MYTVQHIYIVHCTLCTFMVFLMYTIYGTLYGNSVYQSLYVVQCTVYIVQCTLYVVQCTMYRPPIHNIPSTTYDNVHNTLYIARVYISLPFLHDPTWQGNALASGYVIPPASSRVYYATRPWGYISRYRTKAGVWCNARNDVMPIFTGRDRWLSFRLKLEIIE